MSYKMMDNKKGLDIEIVILKHRAIATLNLRFVSKTLDVGFRRKKSTAYS